jgi:hypothetical protein
MGCLESVKVEAPAFYFTRLGTSSEVMAKLDQIKMQNSANSDMWAFWNQTKGSASASLRPNPRDVQKSNL